MQILAWRGNLRVRHRSVWQIGILLGIPPSPMASNTTVAIPIDVKHRLDQIHEETARDADSAPFWFTVDRAIEALADEQGVTFDE